MEAIKNMEIPKSCADCERGSICGYGLGYGRPDDCPLVEIVTCKDCKYCEEVHYENEDEPPYVKLKCNSTRNTRFYRVEEDFYCGDGERKE